jgi:hypothetical protein
MSSWSMVLNQLEKTATLLRKESMHSLWDDLGAGLIGGIIGGIAGGLAGGLIGLIWALLQPRRYCPECATPLPKIGLKCRRSFWRGGWICLGCGCEIDRKGRKVLPKQEAV